MNKYKIKKFNKIKKSIYIYNSKIQQNKKKLVFLLQL